MKKTFYILSIITLSTLSSNDIFAYGETTYSSEQFRMDIKSYLDDQVFRQKTQDIINDLNSGYSNTQRNFDINMMQQQLDASKKSYDDTSEQIRQVQEVINQQNKILLEQKKTDDENQTYKNSKALCEEVKIKYPEGVMRDLSDNCIKYGVYIKTEVLPRPSYLDDPIENKTKIVPKTKVNPVKEITSSSTAVLETTSSPILLPNTASVPKQSLYRKTLEKIKLLFGWGK